jgi:lipopolysaccharide transport system ATP-binding protein
VSDIVLKVENLWKQYRLGVVGAGSLREDVGRWMAKLRGKDDPTLKVGETNDRESIKGNHVWALQDINFEIKRGEVVGIIGKNGAGKSTLLKILSKVTTPTKGSIKVKGRIASLLEVGTGFHPELTGRENIFLNGAILGMGKSEIRAKFDEIVDFSGIGKYIDTPVKRYSSGMYVRLAFAVAAHLEPEILIVDEVLAVGDADFQKKCLGKMKDVSQEGRTVLFVSHNMRVISSLCPKSIFLEKGRVKRISNTDIVINDYLSNIQKSVSSDIYSYRLDGNSKKEIKIEVIEILESKDSSIYFEQDLNFIIHIKSEQDIDGLTLNASVYNLHEICVIAAPNQTYFSIKKDEIMSLKLTIKTGECLVPDTYLMAFSILKGSNLGGYEALDVIYGYPMINILPNPNQPLESNISNWNSKWGNIKIDSIVKINV